VSFRHHDDSVKGAAGRFAEGDEVFAACKAGGLTNLKRVRLNRTAISNAGLNELAGLKNLDYVEAFGTMADGRQGNDSG